MGKTIAIGDIHGRNTWKEIVKEPHDKVIFIGDYFDTHQDISAIVQLANFQDIIDFKKENPDKVVLLTGNHDYHYGLGYKERYSGYQYEHAFLIEELLRENLSDLRMAHLDQNILYSHAGVTKTFCELNGLDEYQVGEDLDEQINSLFFHQPNTFRFNGNDPYGDDVTQSCIWVRPRSLAKDSIDIKQVFGHTQISMIKDLHGRFWDIDVLGTSKEFLIVEDGVVTIKKLEGDNV